EPAARTTGDVAPLAPGPGPAHVGRLRSTPANGPAAAPGRVPRPRPSARRGASDLGLPANPRRVAHARPRRLGDRDPAGPAPARSPARAAPGRTVLADVPPCPRRGSARLRLLRGRDRPAAS